MIVREILKRVGETPTCQTPPRFGEKAVGHVGGMGLPHREGREKVCTCWIAGMLGE